MTKWIQVGRFGTRVSHGPAQKSSCLGSDAIHLGAENFLPLISSCLVMLMKYVFDPSNLPIDEQLDQKPLFSADQYWDIWQDEIPKQI